MQVPFICVLEREISFSVLERLSCRLLWPLKNKIEREAAILFEFRMVYQHRNSSRSNQYSFFWTFCCSFDLHGVARVVLVLFSFSERKWVTLSNVPLPGKLKPKLSSCFLTDFLIETNCLLFLFHITQTTEKRLPVTCVPWGCRWLGVHLITCSGFADDQTRNWGRMKIAKRLC